MRLRQGFGILGAVAALLAVACSGEGEGGDSNAANPSTPSGGAVAAGSPAGGAAAVGMAGTMQGSAGRAGGQSIAPGGAGTAGTAGAVPGGTSGMTGGAGGRTGTGGAPEEEPPEPIGELDCGPNGVVIENAGPASNRVNYVIVGDGYSASELETTFIEHIEFAIGQRFSARSASRICGTGSSSTSARSRW